MAGHRKAVGLLFAMILAGCGAEPPSSTSHVNSPDCSDAIRRIEKRVKEHGEILGRLSTKLDAQADGRFALQGQVEGLRKEIAEQSSKADALQRQISANDAKVHDRLDVQSLAVEKFGRAVLDHWAVDSMVEDFATRSKADQWPIVNALIRKPELDAREVSALPRLSKYYGQDLAWRRQQHQQMINRIEPAPKTKPESPNPQRVGPTEPGGFEMN